MAQKIIPNSGEMISEKEKPSHAGAIAPHAGKHPNNDGTCDSENDPFHFSTARWQSQNALLSASEVALG
jgi:hypothetical protein